MPYPIKNTTAQQTNTVRTLNFAFGVNQGGYGLTSATAFWNGKPPNVGGYVVYIGNGTSTPTMYTFHNDTGVIQFATNLGCTYCTTIVLSLFYILNSGTAICLNVEPPNIVTSGLALYFDAGFTTSYPKGLNTWLDMSPNLGNGTLLNGPTYSSDVGGCIVFDGADDRVDTTLSELGPNATYEVMINSYGNVNTYNMFIGQYLPYVGVLYGDRIVYSDYINGSQTWFTTNPGTIISNTYHHIVCTREYDSYFGTTTQIIYIDGVLSAAITPVGQRNIFYAPYNINIGDGVAFTWYPFYGKIPMARVYNRALSATEVLQNYYASLQRLIPTDNMILWLDGTNTNTRVITPTTAYDRSGNNYNGTFTNGAILAHRDGGTVFSLDGVSDKIQTTLNTLASSTTWNVWIKRTQSVDVYNMIMGMLLPYFSSMSDGSIHFSNNIGGSQRSLYAYVGLTDNIWYNITFVSSFSAGNTTMMIYLNGVLQTQATYAGQQPTTTTYSFRLGDWEDGGSYPFKGKIGGVRMYSRVLTATEISTIYNADRPRYGL